MQTQHLRCLVGPGLVPGRSGTGYIRLVGQMLAPRRPAALPISSGPSHPVEQGLVPCRPGADTVLTMAPTQRPATQALAPPRPAEPVQPEIAERRGQRVQADLLADEVAAADE